MNFGSTLRTYCIQKGYSQKQLAEKLNISIVALSKWENNRSYPDIMTLKPLAYILGISTDEMLGLHDCMLKETAETLLHAISEKQKAGDREGAADIVKTAVRDYLNHDAFLSQAVILLYDTLKDQTILQEWVDQVLSCDDGVIVRQLTKFLFHKTVNAQDLSKAAFYADYFDSDTYMRKSMDIDLCQMKGDQQTAYRKTEELLFVRLL